MANTLNLKASEFPGAFQKLNALLKILKAKKGYKVSARKLAIDALSEGLDILLERERKNDNQPMELG